MENFDFLFKHWEEMDKSYETFHKLSLLSCPQGCSSCCKDHQVHTTSFEMLPAALRLFREDKTDSILEHIETYPPGRCALLHDDKCITYDERPSLCRLFGMGRIENKNSFSICKIIKEQNPEQVKNLVTIEELKHIKSYGQLYFPLITLIPRNEAEEVPLNQALKKAIEKVLLYSNYQ